MNDIIILGLYLLSGICIYASIVHLSYGLRRPPDSTHIMFAGLCLLSVPLSLFHGMEWTATATDEFITALKWSLACAILFFGLFVWFIAGYTGVRPLPLLLGLTLLAVVLFVVNIVQPYSMQYVEISGLRTLHTPWGETLTAAVGHNSDWMYAGAAGVLIAFVYACYALGRQYHRTRNRAFLGMLLAIGLFLIGVIQGLLTRLSILDFVGLGRFGYLGMIIVMSLLLRRESDQRLRISENRFRSLVEQSPFSIQILGPDGDTVQVNAAWEKLWGVNMDAVTGYNILADRQLVEQGAVSHIEQGLAGVANEIPPIIYNPADNPVLRGPHRDRWVRAFIYPIKDEKGEVRDAILVHEDVTEKKRIEDAIRVIAAGVAADTGALFFQQFVLSLASLFDADYAFIGLLDDDRQSIDTLAVCDHGKIVQDFSYNLANTPCANVVGKITCTYPHGVQQLFPEDRMLVERGVESYIGTPLFDAQGKALGLIVVLHSQPLDLVEQVGDILEIFAARGGAEVQRLHAESHIRRMAYEDYLTGLASRAHLYERLSGVLHRVRKSGEGGALILIDLDHFKTINDALGHDIGDELLRAVARRLTEAVAGHAFLARLGGDEFVALMVTGPGNTPEAEDNAHELAQKIMARLTSPIYVGERAFTVGASIGVALFPEDGDTEPSDIMRHADMALYQAKNRGRGMIQLYLPSLHIAAARRLRIEEGLRQAIANKELELYFQPLVNVSGQVVGAESLLRWHHPELGDIPPATFIPVAEETGLIQSIGSWVFEQACSSHNRWLHDGASFNGYLSVNVCPWQFARPDFVDYVSYILESYNVDARHLILELTETALLYDLQETIEKLEALRTLGFRVALDDFGTGYSSLAYLKDLPLDYIKIDRTFINELSETAEHPLVESIIAIGQHMQLGVIAEGVETEEQRDILVDCGCERFQGYLFSHPLPEKDFLEWVSENLTGKREHSRITTSGQS